MKSFGFIGAGNMGSAIIKGLLASDASDIGVFAYDRDSQKTAALQELGVTVCHSECELVERCKYVVLAVKPQVMDVVLETISGSVTGDTVLISIAAGITAEYIREKTRSDAKVVLVMPNTPLLLGEGATALSAADGVTEDEFNDAKSIFSFGGRAEVIPIDKMKEIIAINGSSPAFIYLFAKGFIDYAKSVGIDESAARSLFSQSLIGSAKMITDSGYTIDELIKMVSSPGGTTLAGLDKLYEGGLVDTVDKACTACTKRAYELSEELTSK